jgi:cyclophilin family peptidyl-prolyl cis-trans isomerase
VLEFETNCGSFTITLDQEQAPKTAASLVSLAEAGFYDRTSFHRVVPGFVIQGGDPTGTGSGGPGYQTVDPPPPSAKYTKGVVAMAKAEFEAPGTSGSQFFVVTGEDIGLPPDYAIVGEVTEGLDSVLAIDRLGVADSPPSMPVVIERVSVEES